MSIVGFPEADVRLAELELEHLAQTRPDLRTLVVPDELVTLARELLPEVKIVPRQWLWAKHAQDGYQANYVIYDEAVDF